MKKYIEKKFTKKQINKINRIRSLIDSLLNENIEIHGRERNLRFYRSENIKYAGSSAKYGDCANNNGELISNLYCDITDSGADDSFCYHENTIIIK